MSYPALSHASIPPITFNGSNPSDFNMLAAILLRVPLAQIVATGLLLATSSR
jgi:hypothetical protein